MPFRGIQMMGRTGVQMWGGESEDIEPLEKQRTQQHWKGADRLKVPGVGNHLSFLQS